MVRSVGTATAISSLWPHRFWRRYAGEPRRPLVSLAFLLPLIVIYESAAGSSLDGPGRQLIAQGLVRWISAWVGFVGTWVPAALLIVTLLAWHWRRRDRWRVRWSVVPVMVVESLVLSVPLLVLSEFFSQREPIGLAGLNYRLLAVLGAGIYEELVFRLLLLGGLLALAKGPLRLRGPWSLWPAIGLSAAIFSLCHLQPLGALPFAWQPLGFRLAAGVYLGVVFIGRGVGIGSGCHVAYNVLLVLFAWVW